MKLILPGTPVAQIRMKYSGRNGIGRLYDPRAKEKNQIKKDLRTLREDMPHFSMFEYPHVIFVFNMPIPKSIPKKLLHQYQSGRLKHVSKPDVDNFVKLYLDCMDGIFFMGDQKVSLGPAVKLYSPIPQTRIYLTETGPSLSHELPPSIEFDLAASISDTHFEAEKGYHSGFSPLQSPNALE